jgi:hypothetical protein
MYSLLWKVVPYLNISLKDPHYFVMKYQTLIKTMMTMICYLYFFIIEVIHCRVFYLKLNIGVNPMFFAFNDLFFNFIVFSAAVHYYYYYQIIYKTLLIIKYLITHLLLLRIFK